MKALSISLYLALVAVPAFGQMGVREVSQTTFKTLVDAPAPTKAQLAAKSMTLEDTPITNKVNKGINFGASLGFSTTFDKVYEARLSPLDNKLKITTTSQPAFLLSTGVAFPLSNAGIRRNKEAKGGDDTSSKGLGGRFFQETGSDGQATGKGYYVPYGFYALATVNLVTFNSAAAGSIYNQKLDGGLGLGYRINDNVLIAATFEMISYRTPRDFLVNDYRDKVLTNAAGTAITTLNQDDNDYFTNRYMPSVSVKFFYLFAFDPTK